MSASNEVILWMNKCDPEYITSNKVMLCIKNIFLLENMRNIFPEEYSVLSSGAAEMPGY